MTASTHVPARRGSWKLEPDASRVVARLFVPGQEGFDQEDSRTTAVLARVLALDDDDAQAALDDVVSRMGARHRDLSATFRRHASDVADRLDPGDRLSDTRRLLVGATFTSEYAIEGAALCNPSIVAHPDQSGMTAGALRFVMSVRCIGEGHRSSIGFRTGTIDASGQATVEPPSPFATTGTSTATRLEAAAFHGELHRLGGEGENADYVFGALGPHFSRDELELRLQDLRDNRMTRRHTEQTIRLLRTIADRHYEVEFDRETALSERVLWPAMAAERHGMEDARFVAFTDDDGDCSYLATYTAYDGSHISQQLLDTRDFRTFRSTPIVGDAAANKGMALFPRRVHGRFAALSRCDRETNSIAFSDDLRHWPASSRFQVPLHAWEVLQLGNCGPPIETDAGWLVVTHGVGPMRTYSLGAILLDLDDPTVVVGALAHPLLTPAVDERDGYVPNVVYSCGSLVHEDVFVLPYGFGDRAIGIATVSLPELLTALTTQKPR